VLAGRIAFSMIKHAIPANEPQWCIYIVNADGTNLREIAEQARQPCFSPDGRQLAVNGERKDQQNLLVMDADGSNVEEVSRHLEDAHPSWSPDGKFLVFDYEERPRGCQLFVLKDFATREYEALYSAPATTIIGRYPTWMGDDRIIFQGRDYWDTNQRLGLYTTSGAGGLPVQVTTHGEDTAPAVYGNRVAFMSQRLPGNWQVYVANISPGNPDSGLKQLTSGSAHNGLPTWSPDGQWIAFVSDQGGIWGIWAMRPDGSGRQRIIDLGAAAFDGTWTGERISWAR